MQLFLERQLYRVYSVIVMPSVSVYMRVAVHLMASHQAIACHCWHTRIWCVCLRTVVARLRIRNYRVGKFPNVKLNKRTSRIVNNLSVFCKNPVRQSFAEPKCGQHDTQKMNGSKNTGMTLFTMVINCGCSSNLVTDRTL